MRTTILIFLYIISDLLFAQSTSDHLRTYLQQIKSGEYASVPAAIFENQNQFSEMIDILETYQKDSVVRVRVKANDLISRLGLKSAEIHVRQKAVHALIVGIKDTDSGIAGSNTRALQQFQKRDFTETARQLLLSYLEPSTFYLEQVALIVGYLETEGAEAKLQQLLQTKIPFKINWNVQLALARMNNQEAIDFIISKLSISEINDRFIYPSFPGWFIPGAIKYLISSKR